MKTYTSAAHKIGRLGFAGLVVFFLCHCVIFCGSSLAQMEKTITHEGDVSSRPVEDFINTHNRVDYDVKQRNQKIFTYGQNECLSCSIQEIAVPAREADKILWDTSTSQIDGMSERYLEHLAELLGVDAEDIITVSVGEFHQFRGWCAGPRCASGYHDLTVTVSTGDDTVTYEGSTSSSWDGWAVISITDVGSVGYDAGTIYADITDGVILANEQDVSETTPPLKRIQQRDQYGRSDPDKCDHDTISNCE